MEGRYVGVGMGTASWLLRSRGVIASFSGGSRPQLSASGADCSTHLTLSSCSRIASSEQGLHAPRPPDTLSISLIPLFRFPLPSYSSLRLPQLLAPGEPLQVLSRAHKVPFHPVASFV